MGQSVEIPMFEVFTQLVLGDHLGGLTFEPPIGGPHYARLMTPNRRPYATLNGHICVLIYNDKQWLSFFRAIEHDRASGLDSMFATQEMRAANIDAVYAFVAETMLGRTTEEWLEVLERSDIPAMRLNTVNDLLINPHLADVDFFRLVDHPTEGKLRVMGVPGSWSACTPEVRRPAPGLGEHTEEVLSEAGLSAGEVHVILRDKP